MRVFEILVRIAGATGYQESWSVFELIKAQQMYLKNLGSSKCGLATRYLPSCPNMKKLLKLFEHYIIIALLLMMVLVVFLGTVELALVIIEDILKPPRLLLFNIEELLQIFSRFLLILIGLELIEATQVYLDEEKVHVETIFLVALIAITRKVIVLDLPKYSPLMLFGIASIILALSLGYFFLKKALK